MSKTGAPTELATQRQSLMRTRRTAAASQMGLTASLYRSSERLDESSYRIRVLYLGRSLIDVSS
jgi:hypothetical protein